jgi:hypothetical protein
LKRTLGHVRIFWLSILQMGAVYDRSEHMIAEREISSFECAVCGKTIENWNSAWVSSISIHCLSSYGCKMTERDLERFAEGP